MITSKEADENFIKNYGTDKSGSFVPSTVTTAVTDLECIIENDKISKDSNPEYTKVLIDEAIFAYSELAASYERNGFGKTLPKAMSLIALSCSHVYDQEMCNFYTKDVGSNNDPLSSRFTYLVKRASDDIAKNKDDSELVESLTSLINTVVEYFDPRVVARVLAHIIPICKDSEYFTYERIRGYYESLVMRENVIYGNSVSATSTLVWLKFIDLINPSAMDILTDKYKLMWARDNGVREYALIKDWTTQMILDGIFKENDTSKSCEILRYIREDITKWIKHKDLSERPENPSTFEFIDMPSFMSAVYTTGIHSVGNTKEIVDKFDGIIANHEESIKNGKLSESETESIKKTIEDVKARKMEYLTFKSSIAFLIQECTSNEIVAGKVFSPELALEILVKEPPLDFGMNDSNSCVGSLYSKRDFNPISSSPINPYYLHYGIGDISSKETDYMSYGLASLVHPGMKSIVSLAGSKNFSTLQITIESIKEALVRAKEIVSDSVIGGANRIISLSKNNKFVLPENYSEMPFEYLLTSVEKIKKEMEESSSSKDKLKEVSSEERGLQIAIDDMYSTLKWYIGYVASAKNILSQIKFVIDNVSTDECIVSAAQSIKENKPLKNFWPITQQYEYEIEEDTAELSKNNYENTLEPGDIQRHRYGSRYTMQTPCD